MATPSRMDLMMRNKMAQNRKDTSLKECIKQFPDCPEEVNDKDCRICPFYKKWK